jgi:ATP-dependent RNA helicase DDX35
MSAFWKPAPVSREDKIDGANRQYEEEEDFVVQASFQRSRAPLAQQRMLLPIYKHKRQILYSLENQQIVVIVGETGSGKSTQLPQYAMEHGWTDNHFSVVITQPRRIAASTLAQRVSEEVGCALGTRVGYSVRFDSKPGSQINYVTDGVLLREATLADPLLSKYSLVIVDEAHERSVNSDAVLGMLKKLCRKRKELRVIVCSATIDALAFLDFFIGKQDTNPADGAPKAKKSRWGAPLGQQEESTTSVYGKGTIISVDGRQDPVDVIYLPQPSRDYINTMVETVVAIHRNDKLSGDFLCFLASAEDIDHAIRIAREELENDDDRSAIDLLPLYGNLPYHMQARVFQQRERNETSRRVIFATNIAECSVT